MSRRPCALSGASSAAALDPEHPVNPHLLDLLNRYRRAIVVGVHLALFVASNYVAFLLRFDGEIPALEWRVFTGTLLALVAVRGGFFLRFLLYEGLWRYTSIWDLRDLLSAVAGSSVVAYVLIHFLAGISTYPRAVFVIDALVLTMLAGGIRLVRRVYRGYSSPEGARRLLIYGAGDAGEALVRDLMVRDGNEYEPVGFVDDDSRKVGQRIHGLPVLGTRKTLAAIVERARPDELLIAIPRADPATMRDIVRALEPFKLPIKTVPSLVDLLSGRVRLTQIRNLKIEDLLQRAPIGLDQARVIQLLEGHRVLVTGAGGSIGSELCRQIAKFKPSVLTILDRYENGLYAVAADLEGGDPSTRVDVVIADITDQKRMEAVFSATSPDVVFHAAAHKHVPLMELNPQEAVKNNVMGTRMLVEAALKYRVGRFVLISTDKAVNPSSVMGTTKRIAELIVRLAGDQGPTVFATVRFGNVLGSNGSVVPRFVQQISAGGPVTVTHPDVRRYFMSTIEAVQLVLHAAAAARTNELFVLEMGEQIRILDLARNLIHLSGYIPDREISITFTGLRGGEKLHEELVSAGETLEPSGVDKVLRVGRAVIRPDAAIQAGIARLERLALEGDVPALLLQLLAIVPESELSASAVRHSA